ncbi:unnamed protein product [Caretta caretta]
MSRLSRVRAAAGTEAALQEYWWGESPTLIAGSCALVKGETGPLSQKQLERALSARSRGGRGLTGEPDPKVENGFCRMESKPILGQCRTCSYSSTSCSWKQTLAE